MINSKITTTLLLIVGLLSVAAFATPTFQQQQKTASGLTLEHEDEMLNWMANFDFDKEIAEEEQKKAAAAKPAFAKPVESVEPKPKQQQQEEEEVEVEIDVEVVEEIVVEEVVEVIQSGPTEKQYQKQNNAIHKLEKEYHQISLLYHGLLLALMSAGLLGFVVLIRMRRKNTRTVYTGGSRGDYKSLLPKY